MYDGDFSTVLTMTDEQIGLRVCIRIYTVSKKYPRHFRLLLKKPIIRFW